VKEEDVAGWYHTSPTSITVNLICDDVENQNFTNHEYLCISGYKLAENGTGLQGWNITLYDETMTEIAWQLTGPDGSYQFCGLEAGTYYVNETMQTGWINISPISITVILDCENASYQNFTNAPNLCDETAWAYYNDTISLPIWDYSKGNNWGWTNGPLTEDYYEFELWAGAGQNNLSHGELVGMVYVSITGTCVNVTYELDAGYHLAEIHLWVGNEVLPRDKWGRFTAAPGQFPYHESDGSGTDDYWTWEGCGFNDPIYVAAHAVVLMPCV
jgi:hypothetical protein